MNPDLTDEQRHVLEVLCENPGLHLREVHQALTEMDASRFEHSPDRGDGWNEERRIVRAHVRGLARKGLARVDGRGKPWYPTNEGRDRVL